MKQTRITSTQLARSVGDVLARVHYRKESFLVERNGKPVAEIRPPTDHAPPTLRDALEAWANAAPFDPTFAEDLEKLGQEDKPLESPWASS